MEKNFNYMMIKNYDELNENERNEAHDVIGELIGKYYVKNNLPPLNSPDEIVNEAKKHLFVIDWRQSVIGFCQPYSETSLQNNNSMNCLGFVPFKELGY